MEIRIAGIVPESVVDGPGIRFVVFVQGCPHHCPGCHNPHTHDFQGGEVRDVSAIIDQLKARPLVSGMTISGGEPFCQAKACVSLAREAKGLGKSVIVYSGYTFESLWNRAFHDREVRDLLDHTDILIDGPYREKLRDLNLPFRGSVNQRIIDVPKSLTEGKPVIISG